MPSNQSFLIHIIQCVANILQRIYIRSSADNIRLPFGRLHGQGLKEPLIQLFKLFKMMLQRLKSIYPQLAISALPLLDFHALDLAMILLISQSQLTQSGVISESSLLFSFLMGYINSVLQHGIKEDSYNQSLATQSSQMQPTKAINTKNQLHKASKSSLHQILHFQLLQLIQLNILSLYHQLQRQIGFKDPTLVENTTILLHLVPILLQVSYTLIEILFNTSLGVISRISHCIYIRNRFNQF